MSASAPCVLPTALRSARWPVLVVGLVALAGWVAAAIQPAGAAGDCTVAAPDAAIDAEEQAMLNGINAYRQQNGLSPLAPSPALDRAAAWMSRDMAVKRYFSHTDSLGRSPFTRAADCGYGAAGMAENIAAGFPDAAGTLNQWKTSPGHNQNLLGAGYRAAGIGRYVDPASPYRAYWTLALGSTVDGGGPAPSAGNAAPRTTASPGAGVPVTGGAAAQAVAPVGTVSLTVRLVGPGGQPAAGDLSGYVFTLVSAGGAYTMPPTNAQGQTTLAVPAGSYALREQPRAGSTLVGLTAGNVSTGSVTVGAGQTVAVTATNQVSTGSTPVTTRANAGVTTGQGSSGAAGAAQAAARTTAQTGAAATTTAPARVAATTTGQTAQPAAARGTVSLSLRLIGPGGQPAQGDLSGYVFTLAGPGGTHSMPPTNAQGQTMLAVPAGTYIISEEPRANSTPVGFQVGGVMSSSVTVTGGQTAAVAATNLVSIASSTANPVSQAATPTSSSGAGTQSVVLSAACNNVVLTWPAGTPLSVVAAAIAPRDGIAAIWRYDSARGTFSAFTPVAGWPSDYTTVQARFEAVFICMKTPGTLARPAQ